MHTIDELLKTDSDSSYPGVLQSLKSLSEKDKSTPRSNIHTLQNVKNASEFEVS